MFLTKILSTSKNVPSDPLSSILNPSPVIPDINVDVPMVFVSAIFTSPAKVAVPAFNCRTPLLLLSPSLVMFELSTARIDFAVPLVLLKFIDLTLNFYHMLQKSNI